MKLKPLVVALTGGIAAGKSTIAGFFSDLGVPVIDADAIAHDLLSKEGPTLSKVFEMFGDEVVTEHGTLNRAKLRNLIFQDSRKKKQLENLLHPKIFSKIKSLICEVSLPYCVLEIPLLAEVGVPSWVDIVIVVDVREDTQLDRLTARDGFSRTEAKIILASQASRNERATIADIIINNEMPPDQARKCVNKLHRQFKNR